MLLMVVAIVTPSVCVMVLFLSHMMKAESQSAPQMFMKLYKIRKALRKCRLPLSRESFRMQVTPKTESVVPCVIAELS